MSIESSPTVNRGLAAPAHPGLSLRTLATVAAFLLEKINMTVSFARPLALCAAAIAASTLSSSFALADQTLEIQLLGRFETGIFADGGSEITAYDPRTKRLFITNGANNAVDAVSIVDPSNPVPVFSIDMSSYGAGVTSVAVRDGKVAVAVVSNPSTDPGKVVFFTTDGSFRRMVTVGSLPDMITFTPDGRYLLVANEGEPNSDYTIDPEGSISIIHVPASINGITQGQVRTADFRSFNPGNIHPDVRIFGPGESVAQDLEPEYIAVSADSRTAYATLQENNAVAVIDIRRARVMAIVPLGFKSHMLPGNGIDASDRDFAINIANWPVYGMYMPDAIAAFEINGQQYLVTANEGDARDYDGFAEEARVKDLVLDPIAFPNAAQLRTDAQIGRLTVTTTMGDWNNDGMYEELYAFGARSFSIWNASGQLVWDSGDQFEQITAALSPADFNSNNDENDTFDNRSDNKGPEPEGIAVGTFNGRTYAFIGLERIGGIMVYDVTNPQAPEFVQYLNNRDFAGDPELGTAGDLGPEGLLVIPAEQSPSGEPLLVVSNEVSGTTTIYRINITQ